MVKVLSSSSSDRDVLIKVCEEYYTHNPEDLLIRKALIDKYEKDYENHCNSFGTASKNANDYLVKNFLSVSEDVLIDAIVYCQSKVNIERLLKTDIDLFEYLYEVVDAALNNSLINEIEYIISDSEAFEKFINTSTEDIGPQM